MFPVTELGGVRSQEVDDFGHLVGRCHVHEVGAGAHGLANVVGHPAGVGDGRMDHVRRDAVVGELDGGRHRVVLLRRLGGAVRDLGREALGAARGQADDPAPGAVACGVAARELGDEQRRGHRVDGELSLERLPRDRSQRAPERIPLGGRERVLHPAGRVVDEDVDRSQLLLRRLEQLRGCVGLAQVGLDGHGAAAQRPDLADEVVRAGRPVVAVGVRHPRIRGVVDAQVGHERRRRHAAASRRATAAPMPWFAPVTMATCEGWAWSVTATRQPIGA